MYVCYILVMVIVITTYFYYLLSSRMRHTICSLVTVVQTFALPILVVTDDGSGESVIPTPSSPNTDINAANSSEFLSHDTEFYTRNNYNGRNYRRTVDWDRDFVGPSWGPWRLTRNNFEEFGFNKIGRAHV